VDEGKAQVRLRPHYPPPGGRFEEAIKTNKYYHFLCS
jgi:hypothetical protein